MADKNSLQAVVKRVLTNGALGVSVSLASIPAASASVDRSKDEATSRPFSVRWHAVRTAVSEHLKNEGERLCREDERLAQVLPAPRPPPPFLNNFGKAPFQDTWKNR